MECCPAGQVRVLDGALPRPAAALPGNDGGEAERNKHPGSRGDRRVMADPPERPGARTPLPREALSRRACVPEPREAADFRTDVKRSSMVAD
ncbi:hypothetical protein GCM10009551_025450 [Nocardiopsis tropica]